MKRIFLFVALPLTMLPLKGLAEETSLETTPEGAEAAEPQPSPAEQSPQEEETAPDDSGEESEAPQPSDAQWTLIFTPEQKEALLTAGCTFNEQFHTYTLSMLRAGYTSAQIVQDYLAKSAPTPAMTSPAQDRREAMLEQQHQIREDRKRIKKYFVVPASVTFGGVGAAALMIFFTGIAGIEGPFVPGWAWASYGLALTSLTFGASIGRFMAGLVGQGMIFTGIRLATAGTSLSMALLATNPNYNVPLLIAAAVVGGAATLALAIVDVATTRRAILNYEEKTGVKVSLAPVIAPAKNGSIMYGLGLGGRF